MGFDGAAAEAALRATGNNVAEAVSWILSKPSLERAKEPVPQAKPVQPQPQPQPQPALVVPVTPPKSAWEVGREEWRKKREAKEIAEMQRERLEKEKEKRTIREQLQRDKEERSKKRQEEHQALKQHESTQAPEPQPRVCEKQHTIEEEDTAARREEIAASIEKRRRASVQDQLPSTVAPKAELSETEQRELEEARTKVREEVLRHRLSSSASSLSPSALSVTSAAAQVREEFCEIRFTCPDGRRVTARFRAEEPLRTVFDHAASHLLGGSTDFSLLRTPPPFTYNEEHFGKTLKELGLTPGAVLTLLPNESRGVVREYVTPPPRDFDADPSHPNVDQMSYEQLLQLTERLGSVHIGLTQKQITQLPTLEWHAAESTQPSCVVCLEEFGEAEVVRVLPCTHYFHTLCIQKWLQEHHKCPLCNASVS
eukprot:TRINITY_DN1286_c0_g3_i1.p1 TRINITY_DN1286_c0_g3~~TRINITY_DN1286_c0_g3_i1.p1  ORF type:complete len:458 (-),score=142.33 TRINITY_DN1286_c0_g3_i1:83-1360(-)